MSDTDSDSYRIRRVNRARRRRSRSSSAGSWKPQRLKKPRTIFSSESSWSSSSSTSTHDSDYTPEGTVVLATPNGRAGCMRRRSLVKKNKEEIEKIQPIELDTSITFKDVGGLTKHVDKLKEVVLFPLMYKEFFTDFRSAAARGMLFYGPPGTGKTLLAKAVASEASKIIGKNVSLYWRKGADILNKWVGESEHLLKTLFEEAAQNQPSIIFFDEIDGLAPCRSLRSEQINNSIVTTLLAEMDDLKARGHVFVIGATNRIDSIDPALRRPGRFDLELAFHLPSYQGRKEILDINTSGWNQSLSEDLINDIALKTVGCSGADLAFICTESRFAALRRTYPEIYNTERKLSLNLKSVKVNRADLEASITAAGRSQQRSTFTQFFCALPLPSELEPLLESAVNEVKSEIEQIFPTASKLLFQPSFKCLLISMGENYDILEHVVSASLAAMDGIPLHMLTLQYIGDLDSDEASNLSRFFSEVARNKIPSVIYIPYLDSFFDSLTESAQRIFHQEFSRIIFNPILVIGFCTMSNSVPNHFQRYFKHLPISPISTKARCDFFRNVFDHSLHIRARDDDAQRAYAKPRRRMLKARVMLERVHVQRDNADHILSNLRRHGEPTESGDTNPTSTVGRITRSRLVESADSSYLTPQLIPDEDLSKLVSVLPSMKPNCVTSTTRSNASSCTSFESDNDDDDKIDRTQEPDETGYFPFSGTAEAMKGLKKELKEILEESIRSTLHLRISELLDFRFQMLVLIDSHGKETEKAALLKKMKELIEKYKVGMRELLGY